MHYFVGWDTGAWHCDQGKSRDALCVLEKADGHPELVGVPWRGNLRDSLHLRGCDLLERLLSLCGISESPDHMTIAIDAVLGWPEAMRNLINADRITEVPDSFATNGYLFRRTERLLRERGFRPMSAVQDLIGSQSTKAIHFLNAASLRRSEVGVWRSNPGGCTLTALESYPAPCCSSVVFGEYYEPLQTTLPAGTNVDILDALRCALISYMFSEHPGLLSPPEDDVPAREGWIWIPRDAAVG